MILNENCYHYNSLSLRLRVARRLRPEPRRWPASSQALGTMTKGHTKVPFVVQRRARRGRLTAWVQ
ncbi:protein of unknown function [Cupriavidus neocaledonicus]|uniref:Uncharacterized protein n=1 Tax=Cupriavidus neocaledonicus TaxID=1040979 RepID=A0A375H8Y4_9BURK|nr:protein of unknown function [Cupriavidus neocaledonicus]